MIGTKRLNTNSCTDSAECMWIGSVVADSVRMPIFEVCNRGYCSNAIWDLTPNFSACFNLNIHDRSHFLCLKKIPKNCLNFYPIQQQMHFMQIFQILFYAQIDSTDRVFSQAVYKSPFCWLRLLNLKSVALFLTLTIPKLNLNSDRELLE